MKKTVLITGTSSGIGKAAARLFAERGWNVVATMRNPADGIEFSTLPDVLVARLDVRDEASITSAMKDGLTRFGRIDALVNNAGYGQYGLFESVSREQAQQQFDVNVFGVMDVTRALLPHLRANKAGVIVNVSSGAGLFTLPMISLYCASKFALEGFSEALAYELASQNIAVKLVIPHGGVGATRFMERQAADSAVGTTPGDYDDFVAATNAAFARMAAARSITAVDVAACIFDAVTDGSERLRYLIGDDARGFVKARRGKSEEDYIAFMRAHFTLNR